jgi:uncharacterized membrane protein
MSTPLREARAPHFWRYTLVGLLTFAPLWVTWLVIDIVVGYLSRAGRPGVTALAGGLRPLSPAASELMLHPWFSWVLAVAITLAALYLLGWATTLVVGRRLIALFESVLQRIPFARAIYASTQRFISAMREQPAGMQRVVFIRFPNDDMLTVGLVTRVMRDADTGREVAAVYVPTAPNPTSGYIELVPLDRITESDWTVEEAMRFVVTGGTSAPDVVRFGPLPVRADEPEPVKS